MQYKHNQAEVEQSHYKVVYQEKYLTTDFFCKGNKT